MATTHKITRAYVLEANSRKEAREQFALMEVNNREEEMLEYESIKEIEPDSESSWRDTLKKQIFGN